MARLALVHGAWHGSWAWSPVAAALTAQGHTVETPDLPGSDGRADVTLADQGAALAAVLDGGTGPAVVVPHSHGGIVAQEAAILSPDRVAAVVGVDAWFAPPGASFLDVVPAWMREAIDGIVEHRDGGAVVPAPPAAMFGVEDPALAEEVQARMTAQPLGTFDTPSAGFSFARQGIDGLAVVCEPRTLPFDALAEAQGFPLLPVTSGHDVMVLAPDQLVGLLSQCLAELG